MLKATLAGDTRKMAEILKYVHDTESPIFSYNSEIELSAVVNLVYLAARDKYRIEREDKAGEGFVDFIFYPRRRNLPGIILELKADSTPETALAQIRDKEYCEKLKKENVTQILAVGINYDSKAKEHQCLIEPL